MQVGISCHPPIFGRAIRRCAEIGSNVQTVSSEIRDGRLNNINEFHVREGHGFMALAEQAVA